MGELVSKVIEFLPFIRDGSIALKTVFGVWLLVTSALLFIATMDYINRPAQLAPFAVELNQDQYIDGRQLLLKGSGLPEAAKLVFHVSAIQADGIRNEVPQPDAQIILAPGGGWRIQWLYFQQPGRHEITITVSDNGKPFASPEPYRVVVGSWVSAPHMSPDTSASTGAAAPKAPAPALPDATNTVRIRDAGQEGSVVGMAIATAIETSYAWNGRPLPYLSARFIYERSKRLDDMPDTLEGVTLARGIAVAERLGVFDESVWPYVPGNRTLPAGKTWNQLDAIAIDKGYRAKFEKVKDIDGIVAALNERHPVVAGIEVRGEALFNYKSGVIDSMNGTFLGGHAIVIVSYDLSDQSLRFANSWGTAWGEHGFGRISFATAKEVLKEMWAVEPA